MVSIEPNRYEQRLTARYDRETASRPVNITNPNGFILLRTGEIETPVLVAHNFDLRKGRVEITVPDVMTRDDFSLVCESNSPRLLKETSDFASVFGDSGNWGEQFTIQGPKGF